MWPGPGRWTRTLRLLQDIVTRTRFKLINIFLPSPAITFARCELHENYSRNFHNVEEFDKKKWSDEVPGYLAKFVLGFRFRFLFYLVYCNQSTEVTLRDRCLPVTRLTSHKSHSRCLSTCWCALGGSSSHLHRLHKIALLGKRVFQYSAETLNWQAQFQVPSPSPAHPSILKFKAKG